MTGGTPPKKPRRPSDKYTIRDAFIELLKVRSIITLMIIGVMSALAYQEFIKPETFMTVASAVITYYFTRREDKDK